MSVSNGVRRRPPGRATLTGWDQRCIGAPVHQTGLATGSASVVFGEALLTLEPLSRKHSIVGESARLLRSGGRYGIHELLLSSPPCWRSARAR